MYGSSDRSKDDPYCNFHVFICYFIPFLKRRFTNFILFALHLFVDDLNVSLQISVFFSNISNNISLLITLLSSSSTILQELSLFCVIISLISFVFLPLLQLRVSLRRFRDPQTDLPISWLFFLLHWNIYYRFNLMYPQWFRRRVSVVFRQTFSQIFWLFCKVDLKITVWCSFGLVFGGQSLESFGGGFPMDRLGYQSGPFFKFFGVYNTHTLIISHTWQSHQHYSF